jgi:hypothetical protein
MSETIPSEVTAEHQIDSCPSCSDAMVNGQGVYICIDDACQWAGIWTEVGWKQSDAAGNSPSVYE